MKNSVAKRIEKLKTCNCADKLNAEVVHFPSTPFYLKLKIPQVNKLFRLEILSLEALISSFLFCK